MGYSVYQEQADEQCPEQNTFYLRQMFVQRDKRCGAVGQQALGRLVADYFPARVYREIMFWKSTPAGRTSGARLVLSRSTRACTW